MTDSFLDRRFAELEAGEPAVPLGYEALRETAREHLPQAAYDYAVAGAGGEDTVRANRAAFRRYRVLPRVLRGVETPDLAVDLLGREVAAPVVLAPIGGQGRYHDEGELATAREAARLGVPATLGTAATRGLEAVAEASGDGPRWFQLYWPNDWAVAGSLVGRAEAAGYDALVLTVDSQHPTWRRRALRHTGSLEHDRGVLEEDPVVRERAAAAGETVETYVRESPELDKDRGLSWEALDTIKAWTDLPVVLKGVLAPEDARLAADRGVDGLVVSNHGGRQVDGAVAALDQLPAVVEAAGDDTAVLLDSGVRGGADAFKALALGADAVLVGRPYLFGLAIAGERGVYEVVGNCLAELESVLGHAGCPSVDDVDRAALVER